MDNNLQAFARAEAELQGAINGFTLIKQRWYSWNYWAQHRQKAFAYSTWMSENNLKFEQVSGTKQHYPEADVVYLKDEGYRYYSAWIGAQYARAAAYKKFDEIFKQLWEARDDNGEPLYSNEELGSAIGKTAEELRKFATKRSWHKPRKTKGTK